MGLGTTAIFQPTGFGGLPFFIVAPPKVGQCTEDDEDDDDGIQGDHVKTNGCRLDNIILRQAKLKRSCRGRTRRPILLPSP